VQVTVPNAGHGTWGVGCTRDLVFAFIDADTDDKALKPDTACLRNVPRPPAFEPVLRPAGGLQLPRASVSAPLPAPTSDGSFTSAANTRPAHEPQPTGIQRGALENAR
jgi:hypothetical protein